MKSYILKNKNISLIEFTYEQIISWGKIVNNIEIKKISKENDMLPIGLSQDNETLKRFINSRKIPRNRTNVEDINMVLEENDMVDYINKSFGLSLNDSFWIVPKELSELRWEEVNLYNNDFNEDIGILAFEGNYDSRKNERLRKAPKLFSPEFTTDGMLKKRWIKEKGTIYLLKGDSEGITDYRGKRGGVEPFSEFYAGQVAEIFNIDYIKYDIEEYNGKIVSKCKLFTDENTGYVPMKRLLNFEGDYISDLQRIYGKENVEDLMLFDAVIGNKDRHYGNFGMLVDNNTNKLISPAPVFDNGLAFINNIILKEREYTEEEMLSIITEYRKYTSSAFGITFEKEMELYSNKRHKDILKKLINFKISRHPKYNLNENLLRFVELGVRENSKYALERILEKNQKRKKKE